MLQLAVCVCACVGVCVCVCVLVKVVVDGLQLGHDFLCTAGGVARGVATFEHRGHAADQLPHAVHQLSVCHTPRLTMHGGSIT